MNARVARLCESLERERVDGLVVSDGANRRYLSGFSGSAGFLLITAEQTFLVADFRYYEQVAAQAPDFELVRAPKSLRQALAERVHSLGLGSLGFEADSLTVTEFSEWQSLMLDVQWKPTRGLIESLRQIKDDGEIERIENAVRIADEAMAHLMDWIKPGHTERQIAWELEARMRALGAENVSFAPIVASGPNGAMPHSVTTDRPVMSGDALVIDMGALANGYCSDLTRSFCVAVADTDYLDAWNTVLEAQRAAEAAIVAGMSGFDADATARDIIEKDYKGYFGHGLGHGVGLVIHESPRASFTSTDILEEGMIVTVEPGVYIPGKWGIRIEDMVVVTRTGCRVLTQVPRVPVIGSTR